MYSFKPNPTIQWKRLETLLFPSLQARRTVEALSPDSKRCSCTYERITLTFQGSSSYGGKISSRKPVSKFWIRSSLPDNSTPRFDCMYQRMIGSPRIRLVGPTYPPGEFHSGPNLAAAAAHKRCK